MSVARTVHAARAARAKHHHRRGKNFRTPKLKSRGSRGSGSLSNRSGSVLKELNNKFTWIPWRNRVKLPVSQLITLTSSATQSVFGTDSAYRLNSIHAPRALPAGAAGLRVNGYSSLSTEYNRYHVKGCTVELEFFDPSADGLVVGWALIGGLNPQRFATNLIDASDARQGFCTMDVSNTGSQRILKKFYVPVHKVEGIPALAMKVSNANYIAGIAASPAITPYLLLAVANASAAVAATIQCMVRITYHTELFEKNTDSMQAYTV